MKTLVLALAAAALFAGAAAAQSREYTVSGTNADGSPYSGTVRIIESRDSCRIEWRTPTLTVGVCARHGDAFAASYSLDGTMGVVVYRRRGDALEGRWALSGVSGAGTEVLTPAR